MIGRIHSLRMASSARKRTQENWRKVVSRMSRAGTAESFEAWYHLWNLRDEDIAKLMDGVTKSGVLEAEAKPEPVDPGCARPRVGGPSRRSSLRQRNTQPMTARVTNLSPALKVSWLHSSHITSSRAG